MTTPALRLLIRHLCRAAGPPGEGAPSDAQLLERWAGRRDEAAFEVLLWRHGPMVLGACRRLLRDSHEAEDAFQASFLILVRKAGSIRRREALGAWLHRVACRVALRARAARARRQSREQPGVDDVAGASSSAAIPNDLRAVLDEEVDRLPEHHRRAFILCCLEGKTQAEAARELGRPQGTVSSWLNRARERLRTRLAARGLVPAVGLATLAWAESQAPAAVPIALVSSVVKTATGIAAGQAVTAGLAGARVTALAEGVLRAMFLSKLKLVVLTVLAAGVVGAGAVVLTQGGPAVGQQAVEEPRPGAGGGVERPAHEDRPRPDGERLLQALKAEEAKVTATQRALDADLLRLRQRIRALERRLQQVNRATDQGVVRPASSGRWKERATLRGHKSGVWCVAFSPDGKVLASGSGGTLGTPGELILWDATTGRVLASVGEERSVRGVAFSPDGKLLATAEHDNTAKLRDARTGRVLRTLSGHDSGVDAVAFSPEGRALATCSWDRTVKLWNVATGEPLMTFEGPEKELYTVAWSPDGRTLVAGGEDGTAWVWDVPTGKVRLKLHGHEGVVHGVAFAPDGKMLATASWDKTVRLWDVATGKELAILKGHTVQVLAVAFSPDGRTLASASGRWGDYNYEPGPGEVILWDVAGRKATATLRGHTDRIFGVAFSPDGKTLATASWDRTVKLWTAPQAQEVPARVVPPPVPLTAPQAQEVPARVVPPPAPVLPPLSAMREPVPSRPVQVQPDQVETARDEAEVLRAQLLAKEAELEEANALLQKAQRLQARMEQLGKSGAVPIEQQDQARADVAVQQARLRAKAALVREAQVLLQQAERRLARQEKPSEPLLGVQQGSPGRFGPVRPGRGPRVEGRGRLDVLEQKVDRLLREVEELRRELRPRQPGTPGAAPPGGLGF